MGSIKKGTRSSAASKAARYSASPDAEKKIKKIIRVFEKINPSPTTELRYRNPYELVVATLLSAQCTDKRVNEITPVFFKKFPDVYALAKASPKEVYELIKTCSYPNNKTKYLIELAQKVVKEFGGKIPDNAKDLQELPGIGKKSAHVIASTLYGEPVLGVDTHVFRVTKRLGLHNARSPEQTERILSPLIPPDYRSKFHHWIILHGRYVCKARNPQCDQCPLTDICEYYKTKQVSGKDGS